MALEIPRRQYAALYGPTTGDRIRLADTELLIEIERDLTTPGDEAKFGGGKVLRDGMGQSASATLAGRRSRPGHHQRPDRGPLGNRQSGHRNPGRPDRRHRQGRQSRHHERRHSRNGCRAPAPKPSRAKGRSLPRAASTRTSTSFVRSLSGAALSAGLTTLLGGGTGPATGTNATTCTPGPWNIHRMMESGEGLPINLGFLGKGNASFPDPLREQVRAGAIGLKLHEDWGTTPAAIDCALSVAEELDVQVAIHTDTLNEAGFVQDTIRAFKGRTIHTYHTEGAGGGHAPDIIKVCGEPNCLPSSTNPTMPFTVNTLDEHLDMLMVCHHLSPSIPEDVAFAESRIRAETIAAEDVLHDLGAISMMSSDSQAMGRIGEVIIRTWQTADKMKRQSGPLPGEKPGSDNLRVRRYVAKFTINPAIAHGIAHEVGSDRGRQVCRSGSLATGILRGKAGNDHQGRHDRLVRHGRCQRFDSHAAAGSLPPHVRQLRRGPAQHVSYLCVGGCHGGGSSRTAGVEKAGICRKELPGHLQARHDSQ